MLALLSLDASAQSVYNRDSLYDVLAAKIPMAELKTTDEYVAAMRKGIDQFITEGEMRERFRCDFNISLIEMSGTVEDPRRYLDDYLGTNPTDSLAQRAKAMYSKMVENYAATYPGKPAPNFIFTDVSGKQLSLESLSGKLLLIDIWGTWCVPCIEEMPNIEALQKRYAHRDDVHIMSIACDKKRERWISFLGKHPTTWHQYLVTPEGDEVLNTAYHVVGIPRFIIVGRDGRIITPDAMRPSEPEFAAYFDKLVNNKE